MDKYECLLVKAKNKYDLMRILKERDLLKP